MEIEARPNGKTFRTVVLASGNKLQEPRGAIRRFYETAGILPSGVPFVAFL